MFFARIHSCIDCLGRKRVATAIAIGMFGLCSSEVFSAPVNANLTMVSGDVNSNTQVVYEIPSQSSGNPFSFNTVSNLGDLDITYAGPGSVFNGTYDVAVASDGVLIPQMRQHARDEAYTAGNRFTLGHAHTGISQTMIPSTTTTLAVLRPNVVPLNGDNAYGEYFGNVSLSFFRFNDGFQGGYLAADGTALANTTTTANMSATRLGTGRYEVTGPASSTSSGILLAISAQNTDNATQVAPIAGTNKWVVVGRDNTATTGLQDNDIAFVYLPYSTSDMKVARISGTTGAAYQSNGGFTITRTGTGQYELVVPGLDPSKAVLLLSTASATAGGDAVATNTVNPAAISYSYETTATSFLINAYKFNNGGSSTAPIGPILTDADFVFAVSAVPEPASAMLLLGTGLLGAMVRRPRRLRLK